MMHLAPSMIICRRMTLTTYRVWKSYEELHTRHFWNERAIRTDRYFECSVGDASTEVIRKYGENQG